MTLLKAITAAVWTLTCLALYLLLPRWLDFEQVGAILWYSAGWILVVLIWIVPFGVLDEQHGDPR